MQNLSLTGFAYFIFAFALIFAAVGKERMSFGSRILVGVMGALILPGAWMMVGVFFHRVFLSPFVIVPVGLVMAIFVWQLFNSRR